MIVAAVLCSTPAAAQSSTDGEPTAEPASETARTAAHERSGFFFRAALGAGYLLAWRNLEVDRYSGGTWWTAKEPATYRGVAQLGEVSLGGTIAPGVVFGGGIYAMNAFSTTVKAFGLEESVGLVTTSLVCPFVDGYFNRRQGLHLSGAPCVAVAQIGNGHDPVLGWGLTGAFGYDFSIGGAWSIGLLGRVQFVSASDRTTLNAVTPGLLIAITDY